MLRDTTSVISASVNLGSINTTKNAAYWLMAFCGIIGAIIQGGCIGPLVNWLGEKWLIVLGLAFVGVSLALLPFCTEEHDGLPGFIRRELECLSRADFWIDLIECLFGGAG